MNTATCAFFFALIYTSLCHPLGQTTVCESSQNCLPVGGSTTVCESSPNISPLYPYGFSGIYNGCGCPYSLSYPGLGSTTVYESIPNIASLGILGGINGCNPWGNYPFGWGLPSGLPNVGATTVCENMPNLNYGTLGYPFPINGLGTATVCESSPNVFGMGAYGLPLGGVPLGGLPLNGLGLGLGAVGVPFL